MADVIIPGTPKGCERIAYSVGFREKATYSDVYGGGGAVVGLDCHLIKPRDTPAETLIVFMHPVGGGMYLPMVRELARRGHHVLWANSVTAARTTRSSWKRSRAISAKPFPTRRSGSAIRRSYWLAGRGRISVDVVPGARRGRRRNQPHGRGR